MTEADSLFSSGHYDLAFDDYIKLAESEDKLAQYRVSTMYADGLGVETSLSLAYAWASVASEFGTEFLVSHWQQLDKLIHGNDRKRINELSLNYFRLYNSTALSVERQSIKKIGTSMIDQAYRSLKRGKHRKALRQYHELAETGEKYSQYQLSRMYKEGLGTQPDLPKAYSWAVLAADLKSPLMLMHLERIDAEMTDEAMLAAQEHLKTISGSGIVSLAKDRISRLRNIRFRCGKTPRSKCGEYIKAVCGDIPECFIAFNEDSNIEIILVRPGTSIEENYLAQRQIMQGLIRDYEQTAEQVILGEFRVLDEDEQGIDPDSTDERNDQ